MNVQLFRICSMLQKYVDIGTSSLSTPKSWRLFSWPGGLQHNLCPKTFSRFWDGESTMFYGKKHRVFPCFFRREFKFPNDWHAGLLQMFLWQYLLLRISWQHVWSYCVLFLSNLIHYIIIFFSLEVPTFNTRWQRHQHGIFPDRCS